MPIQRARVMLAKTKAQAGQDPTTHDHRNVAHQQTKALFDFQTQEGELLVEEPHRLAQKVLDKP